MHTQRTLYDQLSPEGKTLLNEAMEKLAAAYDPVSHFVYWQFDAEKCVSLRASLYYALALMMTDKENAWETIECGISLSPLFRTRTIRMIAATR